MFVSRQVAAFALLAFVDASPAKRSQAVASNNTSFDYVIVGAGASGLTVANRLTEDSAVTVLVIEAGDFDQNEDFMTIPGLAGGAIGTKYDWNISYVANPELQDREVAIPVGRVVGGGTKLNRMVFDQGSIDDFDRWAELGNEGWDFAGLSPYFKKQQTFTGPTNEIVAKWNVQVDASAHGDSGPIQVSYSPWFWPLTENIINATQELGLATPLDQADGSPLGGYFCPHNVNPAGVIRSSAEEAYYDGVRNRTNLHIMTGQQVTRLIFDGTATVTGVEYAASADGPRSTVSVGREAILAAGSIHTPQILQVSGIGSSALLEQIGVDTVVDLPAVGENFQDHILLATVASVTTDEVVPDLLTNNATFAAEALTQYHEQGTGPYSTPTGDFLLFLPLLNITNATTTIATAAAAQDPTAQLAPDTPPAVLTGYTAQHAALTSRLTAPDSAAIEYIWDTGVLVVGLQHPFSRGSVRAASNSTFDAPLATPRFLSNPLDVQILVEAVKFTRAIRATAAVQPLQPVELAPGANVTSDADIEAFVRANAATLYHPAGSCKMGAREEGGVVDPATLRVYGTGNLRIVDASVFPLLPATHIMSAVYGVAEKAADIIKGSV